MLARRRPLARRLAPSGKRILLLERGDWLSREPANWSTADVFVDGRCISPDTWYDGKGHSFQPQVQPHRGRAALPPAQVDAGSLGMHAGHLIHRFAYMKTDIPVAGCAHQAGTAPFGTDPRTSVLNTDCRAHEVDNLYAVDTSFFPSISAVNLALTAMANAIRVGDHLLERLG